MSYMLSPSSLGMVDECPRCFWLRVRHGIKQPRGIFPSLPSGMDRTIKEYFDRFRQSRLVPPELEGVPDDVELFHDVEKLEKWRDWRRGLRWTDSRGNVLLGAVDGMLQRGGKLIVLDYKTRGYPLKSNTADFYRDQVNIYTYLLRKNGYDTEDFGYLLFYYPSRVRSRGLVRFDTELVKLDVDFDRVDKLRARALEILGQDEPPEPGSDCECCGWLGELNDFNV